MKNKVLKKKKKKNRTWPGYQKKLLTVLAASVTVGFGNRRGSRGGQRVSWKVADGFQRVLGAKERIKIGRKRQWPTQTTIEICTTEGLDRVYSFIDLISSGITDAVVNFNPEKKSAGRWFQSAERENRTRRHAVKSNRVKELHVIVANDLFLYLKQKHK